MLDKLKAATAAASAKVTEVAGAVTESGVEKARQAVDEVTQGIVALRGIGVGFHDMEVKIAVLPAVTIGVVRGSSLSIADLEAFKAANQDKRYLSALVTGILMAEKLAPTMSVRGQRLTNYKIELSVPPSLTLVYESFAPTGSTESTTGEVPVPPLLESGS